MDVVSTNMVQLIIGKIQLVCSICPISSQFKGFVKGTYTNLISTHSVNHFSSMVSYGVMWAWTLNA